MLQSYLTKIGLMALISCANGAPTHRAYENDTPPDPLAIRNLNAVAPVAPSAIRARNILYPLPARHGGPHTNSTQTQGTATAPGTAPATGLPTQSPTATTGGRLRISLVNNLDSDNAHAYVSALDVDGKVVMLTPGGEFYYPEDPGNQDPQALTADVAIKLPARGQSLEIAIPGYVEGARVWFAEGRLEFAVVSSPNGAALVEPTAINPDDASATINWGFVELTFIAGYGLFANLSFVDFVGMVLGMDLETESGNTQLIQGLPKDAVQRVCNRLKQHKSVDKKSWEALCVLGSNGEALRVISPSALLSQLPEAFPRFFQAYVDRVWKHYASSPLTIDTQGTAGKVSCTVSGTSLQCAGDNRGFAKSSASDIFGCNTGPFAIQSTDNEIHKAVVPRLCAAFHRGTLLVEGGHEQPGMKPAQYYQARPSNWYSAFVHEAQLDGKGYAFAYDDVAPSVQDDVSGAVAASDPRLLTVFVGGVAA